MLQNKKRVLRQFIFPLLFITSRKQVKRGKCDKMLNLRELLMQFPKKYIYIHNIGARINMIHITNKSIETI